MSKIDYKTLLKPIMEGLAFEPSFIQLKEHRDGNRVDLFVKCHSDDVGLIVGKSGKTIQAIQELFRFIGRRHADVVGVAIKGEGERRRVNHVQYSDRSWDKTEMISDIFRNCVEALGYTIKIESDEYHDKTLLVVTSEAPKELTRPLDWVLKMIASHSGRKLAVDWK